MSSGRTTIDPSQVAAVVPTRGDVDMTPIVASFPPEYEVVVWDNSVRPNYGVFGRYMGILETTRPVIYTQDDDCVLSPDRHRALLAEYEPGVVVGNMIYEDPQWRKTYRDTTQLGWGALFDRTLPFHAFMRYATVHPIGREFMLSAGGAEVVFPMLSRTKTVVVGAEWLVDVDGETVFGRGNRMSNQSGFRQERLGWLDEARKVRDQLRKEGR